MGNRLLYWFAIVVIVVGVLAVWFRSDRARCTTALAIAKTRTDTLVILVHDRACITWAPTERGDR